MATVNKDFRIKSGLIVEGANATVNGEDIITTGSNTDNLSEGSSNLYFTNQRAIDAVGGTATAASTPNTVVKRDEFGNFAANSITADAFFVGTSGTISTEGVLAIDSAAGTSTSVTGDTGVEITSANGDIILNPDGDVFKNSATPGNEFTTMGRLDTYIGDGTVNGSTGNTVTDRIATAKTEAQSYADGLAGNYDASGAAASALTSANSYTDTAVANLVDSAPALLDTLNELAAAIGDDASFASTIATQIGEKVAKAGDTMTGELVLFGDPTQGNAAATKSYVDNTASATYNDSVNTASTNAQGYATTAENNAKSYADSLASNYEPAGAATNAINALTTTDIEEGTNLYFTDARAVDAINNAIVTPTLVVINDYRKEEATQNYFATATTANVHTFTAPYGSAKYLARVVGSVSGLLHSQVTEILMTVDGNNNIAITEFGTVYTSENPLATFTADTLGGEFHLKATTAVGGCEVVVAATLLSWAD